MKYSDYNYYNTKKYDIIKNYDTIKKYYKKPLEDIIYKYIKQTDNYSAQEEAEYDDNYYNTQEEYEAEYDELNTLESHNEDPSNSEEESNSIESDPELAVAKRFGTTASDRILDL